MSGVIARLRLAQRDWPPTTVVLLNQSVVIEALFDTPAGVPVEVSGLVAVTYRPAAADEEAATIPPLPLTRVSAGRYQGQRLFDRLGAWSIEVQVSGPSPAVARADVLVTLGGNAAFEDTRAASAAGASAVAALDAAGEAASARAEVVEIRDTLENVQEVALAAQAAAVEAAALIEESTVAVEQAEAVVLATAQTANAASITAAQAATSAETILATARLGFNGPMVLVDGYLLAEARYDTQGRLFGGVDVDAKQLGVIDGSVAPLGPGEPGPVGPPGEANADGPSVLVDGKMWAVVERDEAARLFGGVDVDAVRYHVDNGQLVPVGSGGAAPSSEVAVPIYDHVSATGVVAEDDPDLIEMWLGVGQSLSVGQNAVTNTFTTAPLDPGFSLMFNPGPQPAGASVTSFVDLANLAGICRETAGPQMMAVWQAAWNAAFGAKRRLLWGVAAEDGQRYDQLKRGTVQYAEALRLVGRAVEIARAQGRRLVVAGVLLRHGEANALWPRHDYVKALLNWRQNLDEDIRRITSQPQSVRFYASQITRGGPTAGDERAPASALLEAAERDPYIICIGPNYPAEHVSGDVSHPTANGYVMLHRIAGHAILEEHYGAGWQATQIVQAEWAGTTSSRQLLLRYSRPVVIDNSGAVINPTGLAAAGFDLVQAGSPVTITAVEVLASGITAAVAGNVVTFATGGAPSGITTVGGRTVIGATIVADGVAYYARAFNASDVAALAAEFAALIPGASASGGAVTIAGATTVTASVTSDRVRLTLASNPTLAPHLFYACRSTGTPAAGSDTGPRGLVREWRTLGVEPAGGRPVHHWACVQALSLTPAPSV